MSWIIFLYIVVLMCSSETESLYYVQLMMARLWQSRAKAKQLADQSIHAASLSDTTRSVVNDC